MLPRRHKRSPPESFLPPHYDPFATTGDPRLVLAAFVVPGAGLRRPWEDLDLNGKTTALRFAVSRSWGLIPTRPLFVLVAPGAGMTVKRGR
jgi:hypothetical protein